MENKEKVYSIEELDIKQGSFICICSKRCSGKSVLTKNLIKVLLDKFDFDVIIMFSETSQFNKDYDFLD
jgi:energy-coupling factor transporter ATP-binding protein EcfA2